MKIVFMVADFFYQPHRKISYWFRAAQCYYNVPDMALRAIEAASAGYSNGATVPPADCIDTNSRTVRHRAPPGLASWHQARVK